MFELKTILDYLDSIFVDFEKERLSRKVYDEGIRDFNKKLKKTDKVVTDIYEQLDDIKNMYDLNEEDVNIIYEVNKDLTSIKDDYKNLLNRVKNKTTPFSLITKEIDELMNEYFAKLEEEYQDEEEKLSLIRNRYIGNYNGYLVYLISRDNDLVMQLVQK